MEKDSKSMDSKVVLDGKSYELNLNAAEFVPNVAATEFVPSWITPPAVADTIDIKASKDSIKDDAKEAVVRKSSKESLKDVENDARSKSASPVPKQKEKVAVELYDPTTDNSKEHLNIVFMGHVDAGKSTMGGHILLLTGMVDKRTMEKYEREAKELGRESWYLSWALDLNSEERAKGKTTEYGRGFFETEKRRYTILDAPGHKNFVPSMIGGASQADVGVLVISARKGEFETGFERGGQTREHAMLAKTAGVKKLIMVINKMDDQTVEWSQER
jgi:peptide chain release factor subunit 3